MGAPFEGDWSKVTEAYFVGFGGGEWMWLLLSIAACIIALVIGGRHEKHAYSNNTK